MKKQAERYTLRLLSIFPCTIEGVDGCPPPLPNFYRTINIRMTRISW